MARVFRRKDRGGEWWIDYNDAHGRRHREPVRGDKALAQRVLAKRLEEAELGSKLGIRQPKRIGFAEFSREFLETYSKPNKRSWERDEITIRKHLLPIFQMRLLSEITSRDVEQYKNQRRRLVAPATVNRELECLKTLLEKAVEWGYLVENPARPVKKFRVDNRRLVFLEREEIEAFLKACPGRLRPLFATLIWTGMRKSECFTLTWDDVDLRRRIITLLNTKSDDGRDIPINDELYRVLASVPRHISSPYVFHQSDGRPWRDLRGSLAATLAKAGIEKAVTLHTFRHTFASHLVMSGVDLFTVKELMGHSSLEMVEKRYGHLSPRHKKQAMDRLQDRLFGTSLAPKVAASKTTPVSD